MTSRFLIAGLAALVGSACASAEPAAPADAILSVAALTDLDAYRRLDRDAVDQLRLAAESIEQWREILTVEFTCTGIAQYASGGASFWIATYTHAQTGAEFALIPGGTFQAGSPQSELHREIDEELRPVTIARPFLIARTEITEAQWGKVPGARPMDKYGDQARYPATNVTWDEAAAWCISVKMTLPTGDMWEYACRAGTVSRFNGGDSPESLWDSGWIKQNSDGIAHPVAQRQLNAFGLADMHGNLAEHCADEAEDWSGGVFDPVSGNTDMRELRGGSYDSLVRDCRSAFRLRAHKNLKVLGAGDVPIEWFGFRPVRWLP